MMQLKDSCAIQYHYKGKDLWIIVEESWSTDIEGISYWIKNAKLGVRIPYFKHETGCIYRHTGKHSVETQENILQLLGMKTKIGHSFNLNDILYEALYT